MLKEILENQFNESSLKIDLKFDYSDNLEELEEAIEILQDNLDTFSFTQGDDLYFLSFDIDNDSETLFISNFVLVDEYEKTRKIGKDVNKFLGLKDKDLLKIIKNSIKEDQGFVSFEYSETKF